MNVIIFLIYNIVMEEKFVEMMENGLINVLQFIVILDIILMIINKNVK